MTVPVALVMSGPTVPFTREVPVTVVPVARPVVPASVVGMGAMGVDIAGTDGGGVVGVVGTCAGGGDSGVVGVVGGIVRIGFTDMNVTGGMNVSGGAIGLMET